jgi:SET domain-containing protein
VGVSHTHDGLSRMRAPCPDPTERLACRMLSIRTRVAPSPIHGVGVYACETVQPGTTVWRFDPGFDRVIDESELTNAPAAFREYVDMYAYASSDLGGRLLLPCDHAKFLNHSDTPNTEALSFVSIARRLIEIDDEVTCDYGKFCVGWTGFE